MYIFKSPTVVEGDPKTAFSIAATQGCSEWRYSFLRISLLTFDR